MMPHYYTIKEKGFPYVNLHSSDMCWPQTIGSVTLSSNLINLCPHLLMYKLGIISHRVIKKLIKILYTKVV